MWIVLTLVGIVATVAVLIVLLISRRPTPPDPDAQPAVVAPDGDDLPQAGSDEIARRPDGSVMPGSEEYRNRHGQL